MRHNFARWVTLFVAMFAVSFFANSIRAADDDDPPARAARLSLTQGSVSFEPGGTDDWVEAVVNRPMTTGDKLWADADSRAEIRIDSYALRLGPQTGFSFLNLDDNVVQVRLTEGSLNIRVRRFDENQTLEIDTPNLAFNVLRPGSYRVDVNENGDATLVTVRDGQGEVTGGGSAYPIRAGESANFTGTDQLNADVEGIAEGDDFDRWSNSRDERWEHSEAAQYVSDDAVGYEDLDEYGGWRPVPEYGTVWFPRGVAADWAPYRYGHWAWISPWGWTWVDDAPWGFAPFHYGRWVVVGGVWGWVPAPPRPRVVTVAYVRPVYAPALVAWVGGPRFGVGVAVGGAAAGVAWFPLGPRDVYTPSYHVSERYVERVNVSNTVIVNRTQVTNVYNNVYVNKTVNVTNVTYQNQRANNAVTATSQASFTSAQPVGRNRERVDAREIASAPVAPVTAVAPQQRSFAGAQPAKARPPATAMNRNVVAKTAPPPAPAPVAQQMKAVQANGGRPVAVSQIRASQPEPAKATVRVAPPAKAAALPPKGPGTNRPGQPARPAQPNQPATAQPNANHPGQPSNPNQPSANRPTNTPPNNTNPPNANRPANQPNPNANRPAENRPPNAQSNNPNEPNENRPNANRPPNAQPNPNPPNANRPPNAQPNNPNEPNENRPNANRPPNAQPNPNQPNANRPPNAQPNNPNQPNENRPNANRPPNAQPNPNPPNANRPPNTQPNNPNQPNENRPNANRPPNNPNVNRPAENRPPNSPNANRPPENRNPNERPPAARPNSEPPAQQQRPQQQPKTQQNQQKENQKPQKENKPPQKENKENKDKKDRPPSR